MAERVSHCGKLEHGAVEISGPDVSKCLAKADPACFLPSINNYLALKKHLLIKRFVVWYFLLSLSWKMVATDNLIERRCSLH